MVAASMTLDPSVHSEAFHRVMLELARRVPETQTPVVVGPSTLDVVWAVRLADLTATYLTVLDGTAANVSGDGLEDALTEATRIWRSQGWLVGPDDALAQVVVALAKKAPMSRKASLVGTAAVTPGVLLN